MNKITAAVLIVVTFPVVIVIALLIKVKYPGPLFYSQVREGKNGKPFKIIKMRTMVDNATVILNQLLKSDAALAASWKETGVVKNDPRIAGALGRISRQLSIDELPQLINILKGEMAFIGPRPLEIPSVEALNPKTRMFRHKVLPGITGLVQVKFRNASIRQMIFYDRIYIQNQNICLDAYILCLTIIAIFKRTGA
ncbi:MAG: exopolysaccharide biosynthesis protein [Flavobacterium sp. BFFFF2]|nr:MAG: exopolysaccharide biosynthesis protein [Flavobacterium sp. BFFFF2]